MELGGLLSQGDRIFPVATLQIDPLQVKASASAFACGKPTGTRSARTKPVTIRTANAAPEVPAIGWMSEVRPSRRGGAATKMGS